MKDNIMKLDQLHQVIKQCVDLQRKKQAEAKSSAKVAPMYEQDKDRKTEFGAELLGGEAP